MFLPSSSLQAQPPPPKNLGDPYTSPFFNPSVPQAPPSFTNNSYLKAAHPYFEAQPTVKILKKDNNSRSLQLISNLLQFKFTYSSLSPSLLPRSLRPSPLSQQSLTTESTIREVVTKEGGRIRTSKKKNFGWYPSFLLSSFLSSFFPPIFLPPLPFLFSSSVFLPLPSSCCSFPLPHTPHTPTTSLLSSLLSHR